MDADVGDSVVVPLEDGGRPEDAGPDVVTPDAENPDAGTLTASIYFVEPSSDAHAASQLVALRAVSTVLVDRIDVYVDGTLMANLQEPYEWNLPTAGLSVGPHAITPRGIVGARVVEGTPFTLHIDRTPVGAVNATAISFGAGLVPGHRSPFVVTFDEPLLPGSASQLGLVVRWVFDQTTLVAAGVLTQDGSTVTFVPNEPWREGRTYTVSITGKATDRAGNETVLSVSHPEPTLTYWSTINTSLNLYRHVLVRGNGDLLVAGVDTSGSNSTGSLTGHARIQGANVSLPYTGSNTHYLIDHVRAGLDSHGVAHLVWRGQTSGGATALFTSRRDPGTQAWTEQLIRSDQGGAPFFVVAGNGHAFLRYSEYDTQTYHRAPGADTYDAVTFDRIVLTANTAFPGNAGRACELVAVYEGDPSYDAGNYIVCEGGDAPDRAIRVGTMLSTSSMVSNEDGDALIRVRGEIFRFDGESETVTLAATLPDPSTTIAMSIGPAGHSCLTYIANPGSGLSLMARRGSPGAAFGPPAVAREAVSGPTALKSATDAAGHCFFSTAGLNVIHDATADGAFAPPYAIGSATSELHAGAANQAYVTVESGLGMYLRTFAPLSL